MAKSTVAVRFTGDTAPLKRNLKSVETGLAGVDQKASKFSKNLKAALSVGVTGAIVKFGKDSAVAFAESEQSQAALSAAFAKFPQLAGANADALRELNSELATKTKFDDDATAAGQAVLAQFGLTADELTRVTPLLQDYAAKTGKDLPTAAKDLGKAIGGQGRALKNIGLNFKDTGSKAGNLEQLMGGLNEKVGGFAEDQGKTAAGQAQILSNRFGELQESVGAKLVPALTKLAEIGIAILEFFDGLSPQMQAAIGIIAGLAATVFLIVKAVQAWTAAQTALNFVLAMNPIGAIILAVAAFVAGLVIAYKKVGWFRDLVDGAFRLIKAVIMGAFNWVKNNWPLLLGILTGPIGIAVVAITRNWDKIKAGATAVKDWIVGRFNSVVSFFRGIPGKISSLARGMFDGIKSAFKAAVNFIIDAWNGLEFKIPGFDPPGPGPKFGGFTLGMPDIPRLHSGTPYFRPPNGAREGYALLERGEAITAASQNGGNMVIQLVVDGRVLAETVRRHDRALR